MPAFAYQALDAAGKPQRGVLQGDTARAVRAALRERGLNALDVTPVAEADAARAFGKRGLSANQLSLFTRQLATLLSAGLPIDEVLAALSEQGDDDKSRSLTVALRAKVMEGSGLAAALADHPETFPEIYRASVAAGESSGRLDVVLERLADYAESRDALRQKVLASLAYPILLLGVALAVVTGLLSYVVPQIVGVFTNLHQALPWPTQALIGLSTLVREYGWYLLIVGFAVIAGTGFAFRRPSVQAAWHRVQLRLPLVGKLVRAANTARAARTLALLTASAVPLLDALNIAAKVVPNIPMRESLRRAAIKVREGGGFARALGDSGYFPPVALRLIGSGERSGELERMLEEAAKQQARELDRWLSVLTAVLGPAVILLVGAMVLFIVLAILLPIFDLNQLVK
jgi:general secretion pathway protein F